MQLYVVPKDESIFNESEWKVRKTYKIKSSYSFGEYTIPSAADFTKAQEYRTNEPYSIVETWIADSTLEATRKTNPYKYVKDVSEKIKTEAGDDTFKKVKLIHDLLTLLLPYDVEGVSLEPMPPQDYWTSLQNKVCVCQGYALTFNKFCEMMDIDCDYVFGNGRKETHAWNIVKIDGKCYLLDCTWDAGYGEKNEAGNLEFKERYTTAYLFLDPELFAYNHLPKYDTEKRLLTSNTITEKEFKNFVSIFAPLEAITPYQGPFKIGNTYKIQTLVINEDILDNVFIYWDLDGVSGAVKDKNFSLTKVSNNIYELNITIPETVTYSSIPRDIKTFKICQKLSDGTLSLCVKYDVTQ